MNDVETFARQAGADVTPKTGTSVRLTILGELCSKANSREPALIGKKGAQRVIWRKSDKALAFERAALMQIPATKRLRLIGPIRLICVVFYSTRANDLDVSLLRDCLQDREETVGGKRVLARRGVYANDRQIVEEHCYLAGVDRVNPRVEVLVEEMVETADDRWRLALASQEALGLPMVDEMQGALSDDEKAIRKKISNQARRLASKADFGILDDGRPVAF